MSTKNNHDADSDAVHEQPERKTMHTKKHYEAKFDGLHEKLEKAKMAVVAAENAIDENIRLMNNAPENE